MSKLNGTNLTDKQDMFCREYIIDFNATQAAIRAGYSSKTANRIAVVLLSNVVIQEKVKELVEERKAKLEQQGIDVIKELEKIAGIDVFDHIEVAPHVVEKVSGEGDKKVAVSYEISMVDLKTGADGKAISKVKMGQGGLEVTFHDRNKALELLGKHKGLFNDKLELSGEVSVELSDAVKDYLNKRTK